MNLLAMIEKIDDLNRQYNLECDINRLKRLEKDIIQLERAMREEQAKTTNQVPEATTYWNVFYKVQSLLLSIGKNKYQHSVKGGEIPNLTTDCDYITNLVLGKSSNDDTKLLSLIHSGKASVTVTYTITSVDHPASKYETLLSSISEFLLLLIEAGDEDEIAKFIELERQGVTVVLLKKGW